MIKVSTVHTPKFRRRHLIYPLTGFITFLTNECSVRPSTAKGYIAALRRLLGHLGEGTTPERRKTWTNFIAVQAYFDTLPSRRQQDLLQAVWPHWAAYTRDDGLLNTLSWRNLRSIIGGALRTITEFSRGRGQPIEVPEIPELNWLKHEDVWTIIHGQDRDRKRYLYPALRPLGDLIRAWGWPRGCRDGSFFLPNEPEGLTPMEPEHIYRLLDNKVPDHIAARLQFLMDTSEAAVQAKYAPKPPAAPAPRGAVAPKTSKAPKLSDVFVFPRDEEYENYQVPDSD